MSLLPVDHFMHCFQFASTAMSNQLMYSILFSAPEPFRWQSIPGGESMKKLRVRPHDAAGSRKLQIHNKSDKPDHIVYQEQKVIQRCLEIERSLPSFMADFFLYLKSSVAITTRMAYLEDIDFFCQYLISETDLTDASTPRQITQEDFNRIRSRDVNYFLGQYCQRYEIQEEERTRIMENHQRSLARKKSSLSVLFKNLYRDGLLKQNITDGFNPIQLPKPQPDAIKRLDIDEVVQLLDLVENGSQLSKKEKTYWEKTRLRDRAILVLFLTTACGSTNCSSWTFLPSTSTGANLKSTENAAKNPSCPLTGPVNGSFANTLIRSGLHQTKYRRSTEMRCFYPCKKSG
jgi:hypothetical protein